MGAGIARYPARGNPIQLNPSRAVILFGATLNQFVVEYPMGPLASCEARGEVP